jgi:ribosome-binding factor A
MSRADMVGEEIRREVSKIVQEVLHDPRLGFTTITRVELTPDLRFARIFFSVYGDAQQWKDTCLGLEHASGFIRKLLGERMTLRFVPEIAFKEDHSSEYSILIEKQLEEIKSQEKAVKNGPKKIARGPKKKRK